MSRRARKQRDKRAEAEAVLGSDHEEDDQDYESWQDEDEHQNPPSSGFYFF